MKRSSCNTIDQRTDRPFARAHSVESLKLQCYMKRLYFMYATANGIGSQRVGTRGEKESERTWFIEVLDNCQIEDMSAVVDDVVVALFKLKTLCCLYRIIFRRRFGSRDSRFTSLRPRLTMVRAYTISRRETSLF